MRVGKMELGRALVVDSETGVGGKERSEYSEEPRFVLNVLGVSDSNALFTHLLGSTTEQFAGGKSVVILKLPGT